MKNPIIVLLLVFGLVSCRSSENLAVKTVENESSFLYKPTFKLVQNDKSEKGLIQLNEMFVAKLLENGFFMDVHEPQYLVQAVKASELFESKLTDSIHFPIGGFPQQSNSIGLGGYSTRALYTEGEVGKVIFLIQDSESLEIVWMGTGDGILAENRQLKKKEIELALDTMLADLAF